MKRFTCAMLLALLFLGACAEGTTIGSVATEDDMTDVIDVASDGLTPVTAEMLCDGVYTVNVDSSSSMFKIVSCSLTLEGGTMTARLYMKSKAYSYMFAGSAGDAAKTPVSGLIPLNEDETGFFFDLPLDALDSVYACAALSERKQVWYPRSLVFRSDSLPPEAFKPEYLTTAASLLLSDGLYECAVLLEGKGKTSVQSPAAITVENGACTAHIVFSTAKIDYIRYNDEKYMPVSFEGGAAFDIPVLVFDRKTSLIVDSTAIKPASEVAYSLTFFSQTLSAAADEPSGQ